MNKQRVLTKELICTACPQCSNPPNYLSFVYFPIEDAETLIKDGATVSCTTHTYLFKDGVLSALNQPPFSANDLLWAFTSSSERQGVVDLAIGEVEDIRFDEPFEEVYHVILQTRYPSVWRPDHGTYKYHITVDFLRADGFKLITSYYQDSPRTEEELFIITWNAYGRMGGDPEPPVWRKMFANAMRHYLAGVWYLALLEAAFSLESFLDNLLRVELSAKGIPQDYVQHLLTRTGKPYKVDALRDIRDYPSFQSPRTLDKWFKEVNEKVFTPRNALAHGKASSSSVTQEGAGEALRVVRETIWDWDINSRKWLLLVTRVPSSNEEFGEDV
jgi:hypothetical protein